MRKIALAACCLLLAVSLLFAGCASHGKTLMKAGGETISVNVFSLYLSRMRGSLAAAGADVENDAFWEQYLTTDGTTYADYYTDQVYNGLKQIAAALFLYEKEGLKLDDATVTEIDDWIAELVETVGEGSKATLNSVLAPYGANVTVLRDASLLEAKIDQLKTHLYGANGSKITAAAKEEFYQAVYYRGFQMLIANYYYATEQDANGDTVYYTAEGKIAYDTENGTPVGEQDANGDPVYQTADGSIAYDTENGAPKYRYDAKGERVLENYTEEEMKTRLALAQQIAEDCKGDPDKFLQYAQTYSDNTAFNETYAPNGIYFAADTYTTDGIFATFATELAKCEEGDVALLTSDSGYYLLMRVPLDAGAWQAEANARWFSTFDGLVVEYMLQKASAEYLDRVTVNEKVRAGVDITAVATNRYY